MLYRPVGQKELDLVADSGWRRFPPRLERQRAVGRKPVANPQAFVAVVSAQTLDKAAGTDSLDHHHVEHTPRLPESAVPIVA